MKQLVFINGEFVPLRKASISVLDRGLLYGDGVFETMRAYDGTIYRTLGHIDRLFSALRIIGLKIPYSKIALEEFLYEALKRNNLKDAYVRLTVTRGPGADGIGLGKASRRLLRKAGKPTIVIYARPLALPENKIYENGIKAQVSCLRVSEYSPITKIKSLNYLNNIVAREMAAQQGFDEAILLNSKDFVTEATTSNIFIVKRERIFTPEASSGCLKGITRDAVIELAREYIEGGVTEKKMTVPELLNADEVFLTNSILEIVPVQKIAKRKIGDAAPGPITAKIMALYREDVKRRARFYAE